MQWKKMLFAIIIGIILFTTDMRFGWISVTLGGIWTLFLIVFIVGILAGDISGGFVAGILTELFGVLLLAIFPTIFFPEITISASDILSMMWLVMSLSLSYSMRFPDEPVPWIETLVIIILLIVLAPIVYGMALIFGPLGGLIGRFIYPRIFKPKVAPMRVPSQAPQPSTPPPPSEEPMEETSLPETESVSEEEFDEESFSSESESFDE
ncbi:MAG: hypothetical protein AM325_007640 [Candidatus Thorarchaeota archaeon SMTZ1-45]|nr:MAG: hypothetical protein AM325_09365 [Candidatus Thorarchaeota archaeon SMTZ1-45]